MEGLLQTAASSASTPLVREAQPPGVAVALRNVVKSYRRGRDEVPVLNGVSLEIAQGRFEAIMGPSGSGKSTLLNLIAGLDVCTSGAVEVFGRRLEAMKDAELARWRADTVGFVFQTYNLFAALTAIENVQIPLLLAPLRGKERRRRAETAISLVGLRERMNHYPGELSGGQQQRIAIARAIVTDPTIIIADEPTGDLDRNSANEILALLQHLNRELGKTIVMVTHDPAAAERADVLRRLDKGTLA
jgi:putative ABC transport system ATP-binding protein